ncbi:MAG TPA: carboxypeptidase-like regulatory domain-containing protein, partial [Candidatus Acidoferrum sp.]
MRLIRSALLSILCVSFSAHLQAQSTLTTGSVRGIVIDNCGAVIPGANVVLMALATGQTVSRSTNDVGMFIFPSQPVGVYALEATASGFGQQR